MNIFTNFFEKILTKYSLKRTKLHQTICLHTTWGTCKLFLYSLWYWRRGIRKFVHMARIQDGAMESQLCYSEAHCL